MQWKILVLTSPDDRSRFAWQSQGSCAVTVSYDGKSTKYGESPAENVLFGTAYVPDVDAPSARRDMPLPQALADITQSNCTGCHDFNANSSGPSFAAIGERYAGQAAVIATLAAHIKNGSKGMWGGGTMPPHPDLSPARASAIAAWIVAQGADPSIHYYAGKEGSFRMAALGKPGPRGSRPS